MKPLTAGIGLATRAYRGLDGLAPLGDLLLRLYVANVFWKAGQVKIQDWSSTLYLFTEEYKVPLLPPEIAAYMGAGVSCSSRSCWRWAWPGALRPSCCSCSTSSR